MEFKESGHGLRLFYRNRSHYRLRKTAEHQEVSASRSAPPLRFYCAVMVCSASQCECVFVKVKELQINTRNSLDCVCINVSFYQHLQD